jgi:hypothetical protein
VVPEGWRLVLDDAPEGSTEHLSATANYRDVYDWLVGLGAIDHRETTLKLTLRCLTDELLEVRDIGVTVERVAPLQETVISAATAGANSAVVLEFDLDSDHPEAWERRFGDPGGAPQPTQEEMAAHAAMSPAEVRASIDDFNRRVQAQMPTTPYFQTNNITVAATEAVPVVIKARTERWHCRWRVTLDVRVGSTGRTKVVTIDAGGRPFETCGQPKGGFAKHLEWAWYEPGRPIRPRRDIS